MSKRILGLPLSGPLLFVVVLAAAGVAHAGKEKKVTLCHIPPGNPGNAHTISVGESAVGAHVAHGDQLGECAAGCRSNGACDDADACTSDSCGANGECAHEAVNCDDGNVCTKDLCDPSTGCYGVADDGAACDDGNGCTNGDACVGASCNGTSIPGCCATSADCDDGGPCTSESCVDGFCSTPTQKDCSVADKCLAGFCDVTGSCDTTPVSCDDSDPCTADGCDPATGCTHAPTACGFCGDGIMQAGEECDDGNDSGVDCCDDCMIVQCDEG